MKIIIRGSFFGKLKRFWCESFHPYRALIRRDQGFACTICGEFYDMRAITGQCIEMVKADRASTVDTENAKKNN